MNPDQSKKEPIPYINQEEAARIRQQREELKQIQEEEHINNLHKNVASIAGWMKFFGILAILKIAAGIIYLIGLSALWW